LATSYAQPDRQDVVKRRIAHTPFAPLSLA
jgi:hypothetical protein